MENAKVQSENALVKCVNNNNKSERVIYFDILNILACLSVVFLHMNGIVHEYTPTLAWKTSLIFEVICYWAVPVFIMLSGATLLKYKERYDTKTFFKKRFSKVLIPWIIWSFVVYIIKNKNIEILKFIDDFIYCRIESIYWFFPLILYLYCLVPILAIFTEKAEYRKTLKYIFSFIFIFGGIIKPIYIIMGKTFPTIFDYCLGTCGDIMFLVLGYLLSTANLSKKNRVIIYILGIISALIRYCYTYYFSIVEGMLNRDLFDYTSAISVLLATSVFVFIKNINWEEVITKLHIKPTALGKISSCSLGIYLIHMLVKSRLTNMFNLDIFNIWYRTVGPILVYIICLIIVYLIKKIPILKKIVP